MWCEVYLAKLVGARRCESLGNALAVTKVTHPQVLKTLVTSRTQAKRAKLGATAKVLVSLPQQEPCSVLVVLNLCLQNAMPLQATSAEP